MSKRDKSKSPVKDRSPTQTKEESPSRQDDQKIFEDFIKCELCRHPLEYPKTLDCLHSFCKDCLATYISETVGKEPSSAAGVVCPICLQTTYPPKGAKSVNEWAHELPSNEFVRSFLEALSLKEPDRKCDTCRRQNRSEEAQQWCSSCHDALCDSCVNFHNALKTTKKHHLVHLSALRNQPIQNIIVAPHCSTHDGETVTKYCTVHKEVICDKCQVGQHRGCKQIQALKDSAASRKADFNKTVATLGDETKLSKSIYEDRFKADNVFDDKQAKLLQQIQAVRKKINENLAKCESQIIGELYGVHGKEKTVIQSEMKEAQRTRKATSKVHALAESTNKYGNDSHILMNMPEFEKQSDHHKGKLVSLNGKLRNTDLEFVVDKTLEKLMNGIQRLGELKVASTPALLATPQTLRTSKSDSDPEDESDLRRSRRTLTFEEDTRSVKSLRSIRSMRSSKVNIFPSLDYAFSARSESDTETCWITGTAVLHDGQIILVDRNNSKIKAISKKYKLIHEMKLKNQPFGIATVTPDQIAVTMPRENRIDIYKVGGIFTLLRSLTITERGYGIAYAQGQFAVACACASTPSIKV